MREVKAAAAGVVALLALAVGATIALATTPEPSGIRPGRAAEEADEDDADAADDDADEQATGDAARRARAVALHEVGGGHVTEVELADEGDAGYEVEVRRADDTVVEVELDDRFTVVSVEDDD